MSNFIRKDWLGTLHSLPAFKFDFHMDFGKSGQEMIALSQALEVIQAFWDKRKRSDNMVRSADVTAYIADYTSVHREIKMSPLEAVYARRILGDAYQAIISTGDIYKFTRKMDNPYNVAHFVFALLEAIWMVDAEAHPEDTKTLEAGFRQFFSRQAKKNMFTVRYSQFGNFTQGDPYIWRKTTFSIDKSLWMNILNFFVHAVTGTLDPKRSDSQSLFILLLKWSYLEYDYSPAAQKELGHVASCIHQELSRNLRKSSQILCAGSEALENTVHKIEQYFL